MGILAWVAKSIVCTILSFVVLITNAVFETIRQIFKRKASINPGQSVVVITGCDSGFGEMAAIQIQKLGFHVIACCLTEKGINNLKGKVSLGVLCNVTVEDDIARVVSETTAYCTKNQCKVWAIVNNAGVADGGGLDWSSMKTYRFVFEVNVFGVIAFSKAFLPLLKKYSNSRIINLCSLAGLFSSPLMGAYASSKHAVEGFAKGLRAELRPWNIHVSNVNPGFMK